MIFDFAADGFLTERRGVLESGIRKAHAHLFARAYQINRDCHELLFGANIHNRDVREMLVATVFMRALEHYQAAVLLLGTGLIAPAKAAIRATLEAVFTTRAVAHREEALKAFINDDLIQRQKLIRKAQEHDHANLQALRETLTEELIQRLDKQIKATGAKPLKTEAISKLAGMHDWYTSVYALLSKSTHTHVRELENYLTFDETGEVRSIEYAPSVGEIPHLILTVAHCILLAADAVSRTFEIDFKAKGREHFNLVQAELVALRAPADL